MSEDGGQICVFQYSGCSLFYVPGAAAQCFMSFGGIFSELASGDGERGTAGAVDQD